jgi:signal transduction histidine kinase/ligand-binding sensor domain-containing protein/DNA-binding response OmpR family regulator
MHGGIIKKTIFFVAMLLVTLLNSIAVFGQQNLSFNRIGLKDGLRQVSVLSIHKDHLNRMWFGTRSGLNMWDGERMKSFNALENDSTGLPGSDIQKIIQKDQYLWILALYNKVCRLDLNTLETKRFSLNVYDIINYNNKILVSTSDGLYEFDETENEFINSQLYNYRNSISKLYVDVENKLWLVDRTINEVIQLDEKGKKQLKFTLPKNAEITCLMADKDELWIGTRTLGIIRWNINTNLQDFINTTGESLKTADNNIYAIIKDDKNRIWIGTFRGLTLLDLDENTTTVMKRDENDSRSLSDNAVVSLLIDENNFLWAGTYFGGVSYTNLSSSIYKSYELPDWSNRDIFPIIGQMVSDDNEKLWIATESAGLLYLDKSTRNIKTIKYNNIDTKQIPVNIKSICLTESKMLIGKRDDGISILDLKTNTLKQQDLGPDDIKRDPILAVVPYKNSFLLATRFGLINYNLNGTYSLLIGPKDLGLNLMYLFVTTVYVDKDEMMWLGVKGEGLFSYDLKNNIIKDYSKQSDFANPFKINDVSSILEDNFKRLWVGTNGQGLFLIDKKEETYTNYTEQNIGLPSNFICGIVESRFGTYWISTRNGLCRLNPKDNKLSDYKSIFGFPLRELNPLSIFLDKTGELFVGGINSLISFQEEDLLYYSLEPNIVFSSLIVNNTDIMANDDSELLMSDISTIPDITLKPKHTSIQIGYSACNYNPEFKNNYQYKLEGFDEEWVNSEGKSMVTYTNLSPGTYKFSVRATDMSDQPISDINSLNIYVKPPITQTWYAILFYIIIVASLILLFNRIYIGKIKLAFQLKNERLEKDKLKEINLHKLRFFTNISHEFMTPLTIIQNSIEHLLTKDKIPAKLLPSIRQIYRNSKRLKNLNRELLDFRKVEQGHLKIKVQENDIVSYVNDIFETFKDFAEDKSVNFKFEKNTESSLLWYDSLQLDKVFYNLLSNAFNYTSSKNGIVTINLTDNAENVCISIGDNGQGISTEEIDKVFNRFYQSDNYKKQTGYAGSGIGLALSEAIVKEHGGDIFCTSEISKGTTFTVCLKKGKEHFKQENIAGEKTANLFSMDKDLVVNVDTNLENEVGTKDENTSKKATMLIVEDNPEIQSFVSKLFTNHYNIELADNGEDGLKSAIKYQPDIIISDMLMPKMSGAEMCEKLKRNINTSHIPVILLTALSSEEDKITGYKAGADAYITKPFSSQTLVARVENVFNNRKNLQNLFGQDLNTPVESMAVNKVDEIFLEKAQKICETKLNDPEYNVTTFAKDMGMSRTLFFSKIKSITGQTPNDFIQTLRLKKAAKILLNDPTKNVSEIAYETGFNSPNYFSKSFKNHFGVSPSNYGKIN